jgi:magnesium chelatase family protein
MNRIDIHIKVPDLKFAELSSLASDSETSSNTRNYAIKAREIQNSRFTNTGIHCNAQNVVSKEVKKYCILNDTATHEILNLQLIN